MNKVTERNLDNSEFKPKPDQSLSRTNIYVKEKEELEDKEESNTK